MVKKKVKKALSNFAVNLRELREEHGLSQEGLGKLVDVSRGSISYYENDERIPDMEVLRKMKEVLGVDYDFLFGESPHRKTEGKTSLEEAAKQLTEVAEMTAPELAEENYRITSAIFEVCKDLEMSKPIITCLNEVLSVFYSILREYQPRASMQQTGQIDVNGVKLYAEITKIEAQSRLKKIPRTAYLQQVAQDANADLNDKATFNSFVDRYIKGFTVEAQKEVWYAQDAVKTLIQDLQERLNQQKITEGGGGNG